MLPKKTIIHGNVFSYLEGGKIEKSSLVFLHGWGCSADIFSPLFPYFEKNHRIIAIDFPGFGVSELPVTGLSVSEYADRLHEFLQKTKVQNAAFITHSFGGRVILDYASRFPKEVKSFVLINNGGIKNTSWKIRCVNTLAKVGKILGLHFAKNLFYYLFVKESDALQVQNSPVLKRTFQKVVSEDLQNRAQKISCPVLILWGESDASTPLWQGEKWCKLLPQSVMFTHPGDHFFFQKDPKWTANMIQSFLNT